MEANNSIIEGRQYIVVKIGNEDYGIDINFIDNIVKMQRITRVPKAQSYFKGVINLRGEIIPVMNVRLKFGLEEGTYNNATRIIIIKFESGASVGLIVDEVKEVVTLEEENITKINSELGDKNGFLSGIGKQGDGLISLLNITNVINEKETN